MIEKQYRFSAIIQGTRAIIQCLNDLSTQYHKIPVYNKANFKIKREAIVSTDWT